MPPSPPRSRVPGEERLFSLILALIASPFGLTKHELLTSVYGYAGRQQEGANQSAIERQFERDKDQLRVLGVPLEAFDSPTAPGDNRLTRYRISKERLQLPETVRFTHDELALLRLAAMAWSEGSLGEQSRWAGMKLASLTAQPDYRVLGIVPRVSIPEPSAAALQGAIDERRVTSFEYRLPERDEALSRRVAPLRLHRAHGRWHLVAHDLERQAERVFLLSRITSEVRVGAERFDEALLTRAEAAIERLMRVSDVLRAEVIARVGTAAEARLAARATAQKSLTALETAFEFGTLDAHELGTELAGFGDEVLVLGPASLRELVVERLHQIRAQHSGQTSQGVADA